MNINPPSFGQQGENNDGESPLASTSLPSPLSYGSLPSVPSYGNEDWYFHDVTDFTAVANPSTTSASPMSPYFPGFASGSSAVGPGRARHHMESKC